MGTKPVLKLNIESGRLIEITRCPERMMGHQVIYIPPSKEERNLSTTTTGSQGTVYCFGGM